MSKKWDTIFCATNLNTIFQAIRAISGSDAGRTRVKWGQEITDDEFEEVMVKGLNSSQDFGGRSHSGGHRYGGGGPAPHQVKQGGSGGSSALLPNSSSITRNPATTTRPLWGTAERGRCQAMESRQADLLAGGFPEE